MKKRIEERKIRHVAIIMDGNGRWAVKHGLKHIEGHREGAKAVERTIRAARDMGLEYLTLYAFSTENWKRPKTEIRGLMTLLRDFIDKNIEEVNEMGIRMKTIGRTDQLPLLTRRKLASAMEKTKNNQNGTLILALSYGGRAEIVDAARKIAEDALAGEINVRKLDEKLFGQYLYDPEIPDPDLMIRTSGEYRISNFLLWQLSYAEIYVSELLWPDFGKNELKRALASFHQRDRRFGGR